MPTPTPELVAAWARTRDALESAWTVLAAPVDQMDAATTAARTLRDEVAWEGQAADVFRVAGDDLSERAAHLMLRVHDLREGVRGQGLLFDARMDGAL
ncbi:hypothetical protein M4I32_04970 [Microbacterium sp. LRZ72]|uniref:hypothetical protein n=1 Tax=Microbacterium sp. LRZ72 TaxID=2942481 RepID=UPI0029BB6BF5|nr:hypothetical protein [Microbacterium sp. LRZ72]MDX2376149.1 hypothetical protein [Microbacterium sp. LRZ72]